MTLVPVSQEDFSAGMWRGRRAPENAVFDAVDALVNDEGEIFKRGGSAYLSTSNAGQTLLGVADSHLAAGRRTFGWGSSAVYALDASEGPLTLPTFGATSPVVRPMARSAVLNGVSLTPAQYGAGPTFQTLMAYAGSRKTANYGAGTIAISGKTVTGSGTTFTANVDPGMLLFSVPDWDWDAMFLVVEKVNSNTSLTLRYEVPSAVPAGSDYTLTPVGILNLAPDLLPWVSTHQFFVATANTKALIAGADRVQFSDSIGNWTVGDYHELPAGVSITGMDSVGDTAFVFSTAGVWTISNLDLDAIDDVGNVQHSVRQITKDLILWGDPGIAGVPGAVVVPGTEDVVVLGADGSQTVLSEAIRPLYRSYVEAGYQPGTAAVHRGHYLLPIVNGTTLVDVLVCRLDRGSAWTRWQGGAAGIAYARRIGSTTRQPKLLGASGQRVSDLNGCFTPADSNRTDATGLAPQWSVTTRDFDTGPGIRGGTLRHARLEYDLIAPSALATITASSATGAEGSAFTAHSSTAPEGDGVSTTWMTNRFGERVRLKFDCTNAAAELRIRRMELFMQPVERP